MGINSNAIAAGSADAAPASFQARAPGPAAGPAADNPNGNSAASQASDAGSGSSGGSAQGTGAASGDGQPGSAGGSTSSAQKTTGPSAQTRGNTRPRAATKAAASSSTPSAADVLETEADSTDFGSVMATALGHSAASAATPATSARDNGTTAAAESTPQAATPAAAPVDALAWIAQALMPTSTPAAVAATSAATAADSDADDAVGTVGANAAGAGQSSATALTASLARFNATTVPQAPTMPSNDTQTQATNLAAATVSGNVNSLVDIQKLITGMTGANATDTDSEAASATPTTHSPATSDSDEATQAAAALQAAAVTRSGTGVGSATLTIHAPVDSAAFADEVGARVVGLSQSGITQAQLQLNPADMGPVQVHITMQAGQASVWFGATHADTRAALEQSLPRLRELFAGAGMPLTDSGVFREPPQQQQAQSLPSSGSSRLPGSDTVSVPTVTQVSNIRLALLDTYA